MRNVQTIAEIQQSESVILAISIVNRLEIAKETNAT